VFRCQNEFSHIQTLQSVRHNQKMEGRIDELKMYYADYAKQEAKLMKTFDEWLVKPISANDREHFVNTVLDIDPTDEKELSPRKRNIKGDLMLSVSREIDAMGSNLWSLFNGVTHYTSHVKQSTSRIFGNPIGTLGSLNKTAFAVAEEMAVAL
jgi:hypothetical protein